MKLERFIGFNSQNPLKKHQELINQAVKQYQSHFEYGGQNFALSSKAFHGNKAIATRLIQEHGDERLAEDLADLQFKDKNRTHFLRANFELNNETTWQFLKTGLPLSDLEQVNALQSQWMRQARYAHFTEECLYSCDNELKALQESIKRSRVEAKKEVYVQDRALPLADFHHFLENLEQKIKLEREQIAEALFYRLKCAFANQDLHQTTPLAYLIKNFAALKINSYNRLAHNDYLSPSRNPFALTKAYAYILAHGSTALKKSIELYFTLDKNNPDLQLEFYQRGDKGFFAPKAVAQFIPKKPYPFLRLFPGFRLRDDFFAAKTNLLFNLAALHRLHHPDAKTPSLASLLALQEQVALEIKTADRLVSRWFGFIWGQSNALLKRWKTMLIREQQFMVQKQLAYLEEMATSTDEIQSKPILMSTLKQCEQLILDLSLDHEKEKLIRIKQQFDERFKKTQPLSAGEVLLNNLARLIPVTQEHVAAFQDELIHHDENVLHDLSARYLAPIAKHAEYYLDKLPEMIKAGSPLEEAMLYFHQAALVLSFFAKPSLTQENAYAMLQQKLAVFAMTYQGFLKNQTKDWLINHRDDLAPLETAVYVLSQVNPAWNNESANLLKAKEMRQQRALNIPVEDRHEALQQSRECLDAQETKIQEGIKRQEKMLSEKTSRTLDLAALKLKREQRKKETQHVTEKLQQLGLYKEKNNSISSYSVQSHADLFSDEARCTRPMN